MLNCVKERICGFQLKFNSKQNLICNWIYVIHKAGKSGIVVYSHELMNEISFSIMLDRIVKYIYAFDAVPLAHNLSKHTNFFCSFRLKPLFCNRQ